MTTRKTEGDAVSPRELQTITGKTVPLPDPESRFVHLQFRRYAGCPVCNLHLRGVVNRIEEIRAAGVREVVVFHSSVKEMCRYQSELPLDAVADPGKALYREFGVAASGMALLNFKVWGAIATGITKFRPATVAEGGKNGLPADFLLAPDGKIVAAHYGAHANDQWSVAELLRLALTGATQNPDNHAG